MITILSPWGRSRSMTACASPRPTQVRPSSVTETPGAPLWRAWATHSRNTSGTHIANASSTVARPPASAATSRPASPISPARRDGFANENISKSSCRQTAPSTNRPAAKTQCPKPTITPANARAGMATRMRPPRSLPPPPPARSRGGGRRGASPPPARSLRLAAISAPRTAAGRRPGRGGAAAAARRLRPPARCGSRPSAPPEPPPAPGELGQRRLERRAREVGPQLVAEDELRVRRLPEQVVRHPLLAARADDEVRVVHLGRVQERPEVLLAPPANPRRRVGVPGPPAVVERHEERDRVVGGGLGLGPVHLLEQRARDPLAPADEPHPHALVLQLGRLAQDPLGEHAHQT